MDKRFIPALLLLGSLCIPSSGWACSDKIKCDGSCQRPSLSFKILPVELRLKILSYLKAKELLTSSLVEKSLAEVSSDKSLWKPLYGSKLVHRGANTNDSSDWKNLYLEKLQLEKRLYLASTTRIGRFLNRLPFTNSRNKIVGSYRWATQMAQLGDYPAALVIFENIPDQEKIPDDARYAFLVEAFFYTKNITPAAEAANKYYSSFSPGLRDHLLEKAIRSADPDLIDLLLQAGANSDRALIFATEMNQTELVIRLLEKGIPVDGLVPGKRTALMAAAEKGLPEVAQVLLERGADVNAVEEETGKTPLLFGIISVLFRNRFEHEWGLAINLHELGIRCKNYEKVFQLLLSNNAFIDARDLVRGRTALMFAAELGYARYVELFVKAGADKSLRSLNTNQTAEEIAVTNQHSGSFLEILME